MVRQFTPIQYALQLMALLLLGQLFSFPVGSLLHPAQAETSAPTSMNEAPPIFIGHPPENHYVIVVSVTPPQDDPDQLVRLRAKMAPIGQIPFKSHNALGSYIHIASFAHRGTAEATVQKFLKDEPRARVVYFP